MYFQLAYSKMIFCTEPNFVVLYTFILKIAQSLFFLIMFTKFQCFLECDTIYDLSMKFILFVIACFTLSVSSNKQFVTEKVSTLLSSL